jgi:hypothetical protein
VLGTANHFLLDAAAGLTITTLGLLATRTTRPDTAEPTPKPGGAVRKADSPARGPAVATRHSQPVTWWRPVRRWA